MNCRDIMNSDLSFVYPEDTCQAAAKIMADSNVGFLAVCDPSSGKPMGTLTDRDITVRLVCYDKPASTRVSDIMTRDVISCNESDDIDVAEEKMAEAQVSRLMITNDAGKLVGVISISDLPKEQAALETLEAIKQPTEAQPLH